MAMRMNTEIPFKQPWEGGGKRDGELKGRSGWGLLLENIQETTMYKSGNELFFFYIRSPESSGDNDRGRSKVFE